MRVRIGGCHIDLALEFFFFFFCHCETYDRARMRELRMAMLISGCLCKAPRQRARPLLSPWAVPARSSGVSGASRKSRLGRVWCNQDLMSRSASIRSDSRKKKFNQYGTRTRNPQMATIARSRIEVWYAVHCANWFPSAREHDSLQVSKPRPHA